MAQQGGATDDATDIPESPPSPDFPIASNATAKTPIMTDPLGYIAITLKEVERGFDELNQGLGYTAKYGGRRTVRERDEEFQLSLSKILIDQQLQIKKLAEQVTELSTTEAAKDEGEGEEEEEEEEELEDHPLLEPLGLIEAHLGELQETNADQALDIHRLADTFEKFGDLGNFVAWLGAWVRWVLAWTWDSVCTPPSLNLHVCSLREISNICRDML
jgi:hypothetical protein